MINIFQFLYDIKGKPIPLKYKLLYNIPLTKDELIVNEYLDLDYSDIAYLPDNLYVNRSLELFNTKITYLPKNLTVNGWLDIRNTNISELPDDLIANSNLYCFGTPLANNIKNDPSLLKKYSKQIKGTIFYEC